MANDDQILVAGGLMPVEQPYGTIRRNYYKLTTSAVAVYVGQPMDLDTNGNCVPALATSLGTAVLVGPALGFSRDSKGKMGLPDGMSVITAGAYLPASTDAYVCIADDPNQIFTIQEGTGTTQLNTGNIGNSATFSYLRTSASSGSTLTGHSLAELLPGSGNAVAGSGGLQIVGLADNMNSDGSFNSLGAYAKWRVRIAQHRHGARATSII